MEAGAVTTPRLSSMLLLALLRRPIRSYSLYRARHRRHACALHTLEATGDVRKVSLWLGHSSLQTTEMYLQADPTDKLDTLDKWRPPSLRKGTFKGVQDELLAMLAGT